jgi:hypothetical protein
MKKKMNKKKLCVTLPAEVVLELQKEASSRGMSSSEFVEYLFSFYELQHIHKLVSQLAKHKQRGFNQVQLAQLSGLQTYLEHLRYELQFR